MNTAFETGAVFRIVDEATPALIRLEERFASLGKIIEDTKLAFRDLVPAGLSGRFTALSGSMEKLGTSAEGASVKVGDSMKVIDRDVETYSLKINERLLGSFKGIGEAQTKLVEGFSASMVDMEERAGVAAKAISDGLRSAIGGIEGTFSTIAASVDASVARIEAAMARLAALKTEGGGAGLLSAGAAAAGAAGGGGGGEGRLLGSSGHGGFHFRTHTHIPGSPVTIGGSGSGMGELGVGAALLYLSEKATKAALELEHWRSQMENLTPAQKELFNRVALDNANTHKNTTIIDSLMNLIELNKGTGDPAVSAAMLGPFTDAMTALKSVKAEGLTVAHNQQGQALDFSRAMAEFGVTQKGKSPEEIGKNVNSYIADLLLTVISSRGLVDGRSLFAMTNNSAFSAENWNQRMATVVAPIIGETMKASKLGNADYMALRAYQQGILTPKAIEGLMKHGLVSNDDVYNDHGLKLKANTPFAEGMQTDIMAWLGRILEKLKAGGVDTNNQETMNKIVNEISSAKTVTGLMRALLEPMTRGLILKDIGLRDATDKNAVPHMVANDPALQINAIKDKWEDVMTMLGGSSVKSAEQAMRNLANALGFLSIHMQGSEKGTEIAAQIITVSGAMMAVRGASMLLGLTLIPGGALLVGLIGIGTALATVAMLNWPAIQDGLDKLGISGKNLSINLANIKNDWETQNAKWEGLFTDLANAFRAHFYDPIVALFDRMSAALHSALSWIPGFGESKATDFHPLDDDRSTRSPFRYMNREASLDQLGIPMWQREQFGPAMPTGLGFHPAGDDRLSRARTSGIVIPDDDRSSRSRAADADPWFKQLQEREQQSIWQFGRLNDTTGIVQASFTTLNDGSNTVTARFSDLGTGSGSLKNALDILTQTAMGAASALASVALSGGGSGFGGSGGGITNAAYTTFGSGGGGGGSGSGFNDTSGAGSTGISGSMQSKTSHAIEHLMGLGWTKEAAASAVGSFMVEDPGFNTLLSGDHGTAHGLAQWRFERFAALKAFAAKRGKPWTDVDTELDFFDKESISHGQGAWRHVTDLHRGNLYAKAYEQYAGGLQGLRERNARGALSGFHPQGANAVIAGIVGDKARFEAEQRILNHAARAGDKALIDLYHKQHAVPTVVVPPPRQASPSQPDVAPSGGRMTSAQNMPPIEITLHSHHHLDGKKIASSTTKHMASAARFPTNMGGPNTHGHYVSPGTPITDAA